MNITQRLLELDPTLELHNEGDWQNPLDSAKPGFTSFNDAGIETEVGEFLYGMVRILKPEHVLETGTHVGVGAAYIGQALKDNKQGRLDTVEFNPANHNNAQNRIEKLDLVGQVTCHFGDSMSFDPHRSSQAPVNPGKYGLIFLDTEPQLRFQEFIKFVPYLATGGFIFIHDLHRHMGQHDNAEHGFGWPFGRIPQEFNNIVAQFDLRPFHFPTPRGLTGFYKPHSGDYKWDKSG